jgi:hypothetical protein
MTSHNSMSPERAVALTRCHTNGKCIATAFTIHDDGTVTLESTSGSKNNKMSKASLALLRLGAEQEGKMMKLRNKMRAKLAQRQ